MNARDRRNNPEKNNNKTISYVQNYSEGIISKHKAQGGLALFSLSK